MQKSRLFRMLLLGFLLLALAACGQTEKKAQLLHDQAAQLEQAGDFTGALTQYQQVLAAYPESKAAQQAQADISRLLEFLEHQRKVELARNIKAISYSAIESIVRVLDGYQAMFQRLPAKSADFDQQDFFFDRAYLAATVPEDVIVYLALGVDGAYRLWSLKGDGDDCHCLDGKTATFSQIGREQAMEEISTRFVEEGRQGGLVFLLPRS